jgi:DNA-binding LacI/PurR family transcriptional regulator
MFLKMVVQSIAQLLFFQRVIKIKKKNVTIKTVAKEAGVSPSTVSRVISNSPRISLKTKEKVFKIMDELGYHPNAIARSLAINETKTIGLVIPCSSEDFYMNSFFQESLRGIAHIANTKGYDLLISSSNENEIDVVKRFINSKKVDGIILMRSSLKDESIRYLRKREFPFVLIGTCMEYNDIYEVDTDNFLASYDLTKHLIQRNCKKIAFIGGEHNSIVTIKRLEGYKKAMENFNLRLYDEFIITDKFSEEKGYNSMQKLLDLNIIPDGIIITDDLMCAGAIKKLQEKNLKVPKDVLIAAFNDGIFTKYSNPPITSIKIHSSKLGERACEVLFDIMHNNNVDKRNIINYELIMRASTNS